jgi:type IV pilus biogenesis protein CpaD/CtpE
MRALLLLLLLLPAACAYTDPVYRPGDWMPRGVSDRNLAVMVAEPSDLIYGRGETGADAKLATAAINRLWTDKVKPLPAVGSQSDIAAPPAPQSSSSSSSGGP